MLRKSTYNKIKAGIELYKKQHVEDRLRHPDRSPMSWGGQVKSLIERVCREDRHPCTDATINETIKYLVDTKVLVSYLGDYTFPQATPLPTREEIEAEVKKVIGKLE